MSDAVAVALIGIVSSLLTSLIAIIPTLMNSRKETAKQLKEADEMIKKQIESCKQEISGINTMFEKYKREDEHRWMQQTRVRILQMDEDLCDGNRRYPSRGSMEQAVKDCDDYQKYIAAHDDFHNGIGEAAIEHIMEVYSVCKAKNLFSKEKSETP